jgi:hypothetical protein
MGAAPTANAEMDGDAAGCHDKDDKVLPSAQPARTDSHRELPGSEAAREVESPVNRPVEMQGEGHVGGAAAERSAGPHEMAAEN